MLVLFLSSCNKEKCIKEYIDNSYLKEYYVIQDYCENYDNYSKISYYYNNLLAMEGYGERNNKQGEWRFFNAKNYITKGKFNNSFPIGTWNYLKLKNIEWEKFYNDNQNFVISIPKKWRKIIGSNKKEYMFLDNENDFNLKIGVTFGSTDKKLKDFIDDYITFIKNNQSAEKIVSKKINYKEKELNFECYELNYLNITPNLTEHKTTLLVYKYDNTVFFVSSVLKENSSADYKILQEQIMYSFKIVNKK